MGSLAEQASSRCVKEDVLFKQHRARRIRDDLNPSSGPISLTWLCATFLTGIVRTFLYPGWPPIR